MRGVALVYMRRVPSSPQLKAAFKDLKLLRHHFLSVATVKILGSDGRLGRIYGSGLGGDSGTLSSGYVSFMGHLKKILGNHF